ncbi:MAG: maleylpyruvate isomerase family mycothiol-dependent enzyme [Thermomicrobiaceae bacterium]|nr:maleylpyruvate isomerase family mycothiol-dependent enzyme [Thermomicrobiaceae bacterium]
MQWDATNPASKRDLLRVVREEAEKVFRLAAVPEHWEAPTASGHWQVRDVIGHMVDVTEGYLPAFALARSGDELPGALGARVMGQRLDERALAFRSVPQDELLRRLRGDFDRMMAIFESLSAEEWTGLIVPHTYMGPLPAFFYPVFHLMDYGVHGWDIREGLGLPNGVPGDVADFLAPFMLILWQATTDTARVGAEPIEVGIRVSGRAASAWRVQVSESGFLYQAATLDGADLPVIFEFDPGSLVLTAFGRVRAGTAYGDQAVADRFRGLFFSI